MKNIIAILIAAVFCGCSGDYLVKEAEVEEYLDKSKWNNGLQQDLAELRFWEKKLENDSVNHVYLAEAGSAHLSLFRRTNNIDHLERAGEMLAKASGTVADKRPELLQALAQLSITRHRFRDAATYNEKAMKANASPYVTALLSFDAALELGSYPEAKGWLSTVANRRTFDYMIRQSRFEDVQGNTGESLKLMEAAMEKAKSNDASLYAWSLGNLADMYGHAGRIKESYELYRRVLAMEPGNTHALKGIAWISYAYDGNIQLARRIAVDVWRHDAAPDHLLFLAELAQHEGKHDRKENYLGMFVRKVTSPAYGAMYNKYLIEIYSENKATLPLAMRLAAEEVDARPTPETYSWLAWTQYRSGNYSVAAAIISRHVHDRTSEPDALRIAAMVYHAAGMPGEAKALMQECLQSAFELGPVKIRELREALGYLEVPK